MACGAHPARMYSWSLVLLHAFAVHIVTERGQRFHPWLVHRTRRHFTSPNAGVSNAGEPKNPGRSSRGAIFFARRFRFARAIVTGPVVPLSKAAKRASVDRRSHFATAKVDRFHSGTRRGVNRDSGAANQRWRYEPDPGPVCLHH